MSESDNETDKGTPRPEIEGPTAPLGHDETFFLLKERRRRIVIRRIVEGGPITRADLISHVADEEYADHGEHATEAERQRVRVSMVQSHLGKLEDAGVIERVEGADEITFKEGPNAEDLYRHIEPESVGGRVKRLLTG